MHIPNKWLAGFLGLIFQPFAFIYLSRFKLAGAYLAAVIAANLIDTYVFFFFGIPGIVLSIYCAFHAFIYASKISFNTKRRWFNYWYGALGTPILIYALLFGSRAFLWEIYSIPSMSMYPSIERGDYIFVSKLNYGLYELYGLTVYETPVENRNRPERGEVFAFYKPHHRVATIGRIVGLPGDQISYENMTLRINGQSFPISESEEANIYYEDLGAGKYRIQYLNANSRYRNSDFVVPEDSYFVLGDNRDNSQDSRAWGSVHAENIIGKVIGIW